MIRIHLDDATRDELNALRRSDLPPRVRDRIEMVSLSDAGWSPPRIAAHLGYHRQTVRDLLRDFLGRGHRRPVPAAARPGARPRPPGRDRRGPDANCSARTAPGPAGSSARPWPGGASRIGPRQIRRHLKRLKAGYRRTTSTLKHKQDPAKAERAGRVLDNLQGEGRRPAGS